MNRPLLLLFVRTPQLGKVKTRLARTLGPEKALLVYKNLLQHTHTITSALSADKWVCYADEIPQEPDLWATTGVFKAQLQPDLEDLGARMQHFFALGLLEGYSSVVIIGSDCPGLTKALIEDAYQQLETHDLVIGPAKDGGYYLLGLNFLVPELFQDKPWSTSQVFAQTLAEAHKQGLTVKLLPELSDVDEEADLGEWPQLLQ